jgi:hypothetical protein
MEKLEIKDDIKLILFNPGEIFSTNSIKNNIDIVHKHPLPTYEYKRFVNLFEVITQKIKPYEMENMASIVKKFRSYRAEAKGCFYCKDSKTVEIINVFVEKMKPEFLNYIITTKLEDCEKYLNIDINVLKTF